MRISRHYTEAGDAYIREGYPAGIDVYEMLAWLTEHNPPGERPWNVNALKHRVAALFVSRPLWYIQKINSRQTSSRDAHSESMALRSSNRRRKKPRTQIQTDNEVQPLGRGAYGQKPLPIELTFCPPRDGDISMATLAALEEVAVRMAGAYCNTETALDWGHRCAGGSRDLDVINAKRREWQLPIFIVEKINA